MSVRDSIKIFLNGFSIWGEAASGNYDCSTEEIRQMERDLFDTSLQGRAADAAALRRDRQMVARDARKAFNSICQSIR